MLVGLVYATWGVLWLDPLPTFPGGSLYVVVRSFLYRRVICIFPYTGLCAACGGVAGDAAMAAMVMQQLQLYM